MESPEQSGVSGGNGILIASGSYTPHTPGKLPEWTVIEDPVFTTTQTGGNDTGIQNCFARERIGTTEENPLRAHGEKASSSICCVLLYTDLW